MRLYDKVDLSECYHLLENHVLLDDRDLIDRLIRGDMENDYTYSGHRRDAGQSIDDMAMRVVKEGKQAVSSFYNAESLIGNLQDAVYFEAENITNWITSDRIDFKKPIDKFAAAHS